ncbi:MAG: ABC transporter ATP-binding protein [Candidatus Rokubacteria bacterium]|nr:ABC transporter ATP-binding protein [Candidatus Rokubacteria bacterium]
MHAAEFGRVEKAYPGRDGRPAPPAIADFTLAIREQEFFCLLGPSGCGKTTALTLLAGFEAPTAGEILHRGTPVQGPGADRGVIFQGDDSLMPWLTARDNILLGPRIRRMPRDLQQERAERLLALVGLKDHGHKYPRELSGGMKQRIQIARVLANEPDMLLMDEPFAALDAQTRAQMQEELVRIWSGARTTVLFITHDVQEALVLADRVGLMRAGPASAIRDVLAVDLPRPRDRTDPSLVSLYRHIQGILAEEVAGREALP